MKKLIVSQHPSAVAFIRANAPDEEFRRIDFRTNSDDTIHSFQAQLANIEFYLDDEEAHLEAYLNAKPELKDPYGIKWCRWAVDALESASRGDVLGTDVIGNLPLHLAVLTARYRAVEFIRTPPRGKEYTLDDMRENGAHIVEYYVRRMDDEHRYHCDTCANALGEQCGPIR